MQTIRRAEYIGNVRWYISTKRNEGFQCEAACAQLRQPKMNWVEPLAQCLKVSLLATLKKQNKKNVQRCIDREKGRAWEFSRLTGSGCQTHPPLSMLYARCISVMLPPFFCVPHHLKRSGNQRKKKSLDFIVHCKTNRK